jgi:hypothetical protein
MSSPGGDWRNGPAYEYFDDLGPDQVAFEFLRRNEDYAAEFAQLTESSRNGDPPPALAQWGLRFRGRSAAPFRSSGSCLERAIQSADGDLHDRTIGSLRRARPCSGESLRPRYLS